MDLYSADLSTLSMSDVEGFLAIQSPEDQRPAEGIKLDYKLKEPADLCDTVAAFANTVGGLIFLGVASKRTKHNVPIAIPGETFVGGDVKARIMGKIISQVTPRPEVEIGVVRVSPNNNDVVAVVRVLEGPFPPYEFSLSNTVRIPLRLQDTNRQATVRDIESLFKKRISFEFTSDERLSLFDETKPLVPAYIADGIGATETSVSAEAYQTWLVRPRVALRLRLDRVFDKDVRNELSSHFKDTGLGSFYPPLMTGESHTFRWQSRMSNDNQGVLTLARLVQFTSDGAIRFTEKVDRHASGRESVSDLFLWSLRFLKFMRQFYMQRGYFGSLSVAQRVDCPSQIEFEPSFPDKQARYRNTNAIAFLDGHKSCATGSSRFSTEIGNLDTGNLESIVCDFMLGHLRHLCKASVDYSAVLTLVRDMPDLRDVLFF